jgi:hypothetical protein
MQVLSWFTEGERARRAGLRVCRVKNKFGFAREELVGGYRDLMFCAVYDGPRPALTPQYITRDMVSPVAQFRW